MGDVNVSGLEMPPKHPKTGKKFEGTSMGHRLRWCWLRYVKINGLIGRKIYRNPLRSMERTLGFPVDFPKTPRLKASKMAEIVSLQGANAWNPQTFARERRRIVGKPRVRSRQCHFWQESRGVCPSKCEFPASFFRKPIWRCSGMQFAWRAFEFFFLKSALQNLCTYVKVIYPARVFHGFLLLASVPVTYWKRWRSARGFHNIWPSAQAYIGTARCRGVEHFNPWPFWCLLDVVGPVLTVLLFFYILLVGGFNHFLFSIIYDMGIIIPADWYFQRGWNHQPVYVILM